MLKLRRQIPRLEGEQHERKLDFDLEALETRTVEKNGFL